MSKVESHELNSYDINNIDKNTENELKKDEKTLTTSVSTKSNNENEKINEKINENINENINQKDNKKHISFKKPFYEIIEVESYKQLNEDISETRFYYFYDDKKKYKTKEKKTHCVCLIY